MNKITQEWLESCTDDQISRGVTWIKASQGEHIFVHPCDAWFESVINYCTNPNDAWPIIMDNNISILNDELVAGVATDSAYDCYNYLDGGFIVVEFESKDKVLRAAMIVFILISVGGDV